MYGAGRQEISGSVPSTTTTNQKGAVLWLNMFKFKTPIVGRWGQTLGLQKRPREEEKKTVEALCLTHILLLDASKSGTIF